MRSTEERIVPMAGVRESRHAPEFDHQRFAKHPAFCTGAGSNKRFRYWARKEIVDTYLERKRVSGGDPVMSTAVRIGVDSNLVERVLDVELGRMPSWVERSDWEGYQEGKAIAGWRNRQSKLSKEYGPVSK